MSDARVTIRTQNVMRRFLRFSAAQDGSVYLFLGYKPTTAASYSSAVAIPAGETSASVDYTTQPKRDFDDARDHHIGFKTSGLGLTKAGTRYGEGLRMSRLSPLPTVPTELALVYPCRLERFDQLPAARRADIAIPEAAGSPQNIRCEDIEDRLGDQPFYVEIWLLPHGTNLVVEDPGTVGFWAVAPLAPYDIGLVFRQNSVVLKKGWPDATQVLITGDTVETRPEASRIALTPEQSASSDPFTR